MFSSGVIRIRTMTTHNTNVHTPIHGYKFVWREYTEGVQFIVYIYMYMKYIIEIMSVP